MQQYHELLLDILTNGELRDDRTGVGTLSVFGRQVRFNLAKEFPAITTKKLAWKSVVSELLWFIEGSTDERRLAEIHYGKPREELVGKTTIWTANADAQGRALGYTNNDMVKELGPVYGAQWRSWLTHGGVSIDQLSVLIDGLKTNPYSRRHILTAWNVGDLSYMALPPCHMTAQFYVSNTKKLSCQLYQRSQDVFLGAPFNYASYALLTMMLAKECNLEIGELIVTTGDTHIYLNHVKQVQEQLSRTHYESPTVRLDDSVISIFDYRVGHIILENYQSHGALSAPMAV